MTVVRPFSDEQARILVNLRQGYEVWIEAARALFAMPYDLRRKEVGGWAYLYEIHDRSGNGKSPGPWSDEQAVRLENYRKAKADAKEGRAASRERLEEAARLARALRVPMVASEAGPILREADRRRLLGATLIVVGSNTMAAYALEAGGFIHDIPQETADFGLAWTGTEVQDQEQLLWSMLKAVDCLHRQHRANVPGA